MHACFASLCLFQLCEGVGPAPPSPEQDPGKETLLFSGMEVFSISGRNVWELFLRHGSLSILCVFVRGLEGFEIKLWGLVLGVKRFRVVVYRCPGSNALIGNLSRLGRACASSLLGWLQEA